MYYFTAQGLVSFPSLGIGWFCVRGKDGSSFRAKLCFFLWFFLAFRLQFQGLGEFLLRVPILRAKSVLLVLGLKLGCFFLALGLGIQCLFHLLGFRIQDLFFHWGWSFRDCVGICWGLGLSLRLKDLLEPSLWFTTICNSSSKKYNSFF